MGTELETCRLKEKTPLYILAVVSLYLRLYVLQWPHNPPSKTTKRQGEMNGWNKKHPTPFFNMTNSLTSVLRIVF